MTRALLLCVLAILAVGSYAHAEQRNEYGGRELPPGESSLRASSEDRIKKPKEDRVFPEPEQPEELPPASPTTTNPPRHHHDQDDCGE